MGERREGGHVDHGATQQLGVVLGGPHVVVGEDEPALSCGELNAKLAGQFSPPEN